MTILEKWKMALLKMNTKEFMYEFFCHSPEITVDELIIGASKSGKPPVTKKSVRKWLAWWRRTGKIN